MHLVLRKKCFFLLALGCKDWQWCNPHSYSLAARIMESGFHFRVSYMGFEVDK